MRVTFGPDKVLGRPRGTGYGAEVQGYEIHHGVAEVAEGRGEAFPRGCRTVAVPSLVPIEARPGRMIAGSLSQVSLALLRSLVASG